MGKFDVDISEIKKLVELVESHNLEELTITEGDISVTVKGRAAKPASPLVVHTGAMEPAHEAEEFTAEEAYEEAPEELNLNIVEIVAPLVGVFYRSPSPDSPSFIEVGDHVEPESEVGLIEAMKVFNPIPSEVSGVVVDIPGQNGKLVQEGEVLVRIRISEE